jgi:hypothetical protein
MQTSPPLMEAILQGILCWEMATEYDLVGDSHPLLLNILHIWLLKHQSTIEWDKFLKGFITKDWGIIQGQYYRYQNLTHNRKFTRNSWIYNLLV